MASGELPLICLNRKYTEQERTSHVGRKQGYPTPFIQRLISQGDLSLAYELVAEDFVDHNPQGSDIALGREGLKQVLAGAQSGFTDMTLAIDDQVAEGNKVMSRLTISGTHQGDYMGMMQQLGLVPPPEES